MKKNNNVKAVIFDLDETILDRSKSITNFIDWQIKNTLKGQIRDKRKFTKRFLELDDNGKVWKDRVYESLIKEFNIKKLNSEQLVKEYEEHFCNFCKPKDHVIEAIKNLHQQGYLIGLISNGKSPFQEKNFYSMGLEKYFSSIIVSDSIGIRKPDKKIFETSCEELNVRVDEAIYVGDNPISDIKGANNAGLRTIFVPSKYHSSAKSVNSDATCSNFKDLSEIVNKISEEPHIVNQHKSKP